MSAVVVAAESNMQLQRVVVLILFLHISLRYQRVNTNRIIHALFSSKLQTQQQNNGETEMEPGRERESENATALSC